VSLQGNNGQPSAAFDFWPTGLAVDRHSPGNLGVRHVVNRVRVPTAPPGPRRGVVTST
jgi:hypothetical protein